MNKLRPKLKKGVKELFKLSSRILAIILAAYAIYTLPFLGKIYPGVKIAGISVGGFTPAEALVKLNNNITTPFKIDLTYQDQSFVLPFDSIEVRFDLTSSTQAAYELDRTGNIFFDIFQKIKAVKRNVNLGLRVTFNEDKLSDHLSAISGNLSEEGIPPSATIDNGLIIIEKGQSGLEVDLDSLRTDIGQRIVYLDTLPIQIPTISINHPLTDTETIIYQSRAETLIGKNLLLAFNDTAFVYEDQELINLLDPFGGYKKENLSAVVSKVYHEISREPQNPVFVFKTGKVEEFTPSKEGLEVETEKLSILLLQSLETLENTQEPGLSLEIPTDTISPDIKTEDVNNLGIKELIGIGTSRFSGSISSRIHNVALASSKFNGVLVGPGEIFSFNDLLGDVSVFTGYKKAYIIKDGKTILGDGGGVCQVSTTLFRAILDAGLPIVERRAHSYRVGYYEQDSLPGFDATVYAPTTDLKFRNDTPAHLLIQTKVDTRLATLAFEIYGTPDGRTSITTTPLVTNSVPPPEDLYTDDPTLPIGTVKQIDWKASGAKVWFDYRVTRDNEIIYEKTFYSNYRPWQAVFLRGTAPVN